MTGNYFKLIRLPHLRQSPLPPFLHGDSARFSDYIASSFIVSLVPFPIFFLSLSLALLAASVNHNKAGDTFGLCLASHAAGGLRARPHYVALPSALVVSSSRFQRENATASLPYSSGWLHPCARHAAAAILPPTPNWFGGRVAGAVSTLRLRSPLPRWIARRRRLSSFSCHCPFEATPVPAPAPHSRTDAAAWLLLVEQSVARGKCLYGEQDERGIMV
ncbi:hypothetical protein AAHA92_07267 [Salvia divinorum]|uniref:Uncharacterized protein n=1 Tax=Salvia divinorum TaxID=28513 RepID=A0ABD1IB16_SALDI